HLPGYVLDAAGEVKTRLVSTGLPLAVEPDAEYATETVPALQPGELVLLLTDGIAEAHGADENVFSAFRVLELVKANRDRPAREILNVLYGAVRDFCGALVQFDDMTAIII